MLQPIIFIGKAQSGKDTSCDIISQTFPHLYTKKFAFATPLKEFCHNVLGVEREKLWGTNDQKNQPTHLKYSDLIRVVGVDRAEHINPQLLRYPDKYLTGREVMQYWGSEVCRTFYPDCWVRATANDMEKEYSERLSNGQIGLNDTLHCLICDARFPNELEYFFFHTKWTPIVIHLKRNPINSTHKSEIAFDNFDFTKVPTYFCIDNREMTLDEKNKKVIEILENLVECK